MPVGTIVAFSGTMAQAEAQQQSGWWVADGRKVDDPASPLNGTTTPDLRSRFLMGSDAVGQIGGATSFTLNDQTISSHTTGGFGAPQVTSDPFTHLQGSHTWTTDASIYSEGVWRGANVPTVPPYFSVIYLFKVRKA